jgi:hypothetical protein
MAKQPQAPIGAEAANSTLRTQVPTYRYVDLPQLAETFSDSIENTFFDGQSLRIEFCVSRLDALKPQNVPTGRRYPACRLVLSPAAAIDLMSRMQQIRTAMIKSGVLKPPEQTSPIAK